MLHGNRKHVPKYVEDFTHSLRGIVKVTQEVASIIDTLSAAKKTARTDLDRLGLGGCLADDSQRVKVDEDGNLVGLESSPI